MPKISKKTFGAEFRPVDLSASANWPRKTPRGGRKPEERKPEALQAYPRRPQHYRGVPFHFANREIRRFVQVSSESPEYRIALKGRADYLCFLHEWQQSDAHSNIFEPRVGLLVGEYEIAFADGKRHVQPVRARFEVSLREGLASPWVALPAYEPAIVDPAAPPQGFWGHAQQGTGEGVPAPPLCVYALENPRPESELAELIIRGTHECPLLVAALTLFRGSDNPLRHLPRRTYRITGAKMPTRIAKAEVDLGQIVDVERTRGVRNREWLASDLKGVIENDSMWVGAPPNPNGEDLLQISGSPDATVSVQLETDKATRRFTLGDAYHHGKSKSGSVALEVLDKDMQWMKVRVVDSATGRPTPVRIQFCGPQGQYIAPYGHHAQINTNWFEDYGADVVVSGESYAYVPGEFQTQLPTGDVYIEMTKGYEYETARRKVRISRGQQTLELEINRIADLRSRGWITADTHVHFISPQTAWLEAQCEGINVVNLLASQWGRLFTNVGDLTGRVGVAENDTIVYVGTENRHHMLGHMSMLGTQGLPVFPMCAGGLWEAWVGDPEYLCMTEWALENRRRRGLVIRPHFPYCGNTEDPVSILLGLVDALEVAPEGFPVQEWYRYLNCGYRVAICGGTDKMSAATPLGWKRTYARLAPGQEFTYDAWAAAVRAGRTFSTLGPLIDLQVEGHEIGDTIEIGSGGATLEVRANAQYGLPLGRIEIVMNGEVVAWKESPNGERSLSVARKVRVTNTAWIAARCLGLRDHPAAHMSAHTSPVYIKRGDQRIFSGPAAEHMLSHVEGGIEYLSRLASFYDETSRQRMLKLFKEARRELMSRLASEGDGRSPHHGHGAFHVHEPGTQDAHKHR